MITYLGRVHSLHLHRLCNRLWLNFTVTGSSEALCVCVYCSDRRGEIFINEKVPRRTARGKRKGALLFFLRQVRVPHGSGGRAPDRNPRNYNLRRPRKKQEWHCQNVMASLKRHFPWRCPVCTDSPPNGSVYKLVR